MIKMTLLEMTQNILSAMDSDEVNSITDTVESMQVAEVIKESFYELFNDLVVPELQGMIQLDGLGDTSRPNYLRIPSNVQGISFVRYKDERNNNRYKKVQFLCKEDFLDRVLQYTTDYSNTAEVVDASGFTYNIPNNSAPTYYTIFDDNMLVFDSYDSEYENTMHESKTVAFGSLAFEFKLEDDFIPPIDGNLFPLLLAESKSTCFVNLKQVASAKEEAKARKQKIRYQKSRYKSSIQNGTRKSFNFARNRW